MSAYTEFFLKSKRKIVQFELTKITHPSFSKTYRFVRNSASPVTVTLADSTSATYTYLPMTIKQDTIKDDLDFSLDVQLGDLGEALATEINNLNIASEIDPATGYAIRPIVEYQQYRSDVLTAPLFGPLTLEMRSFAYNDKGTAFKASAPQINVGRTGEIYTLDRFPMLRGFSSFNTYYSPPTLLEFAQGGNIVLADGTNLESED